MSDAIKPDGVARAVGGPLTLEETLAFARLRLREQIGAADLGPEYRHHLEQAIGYLLLASRRIEQAAFVERHITDPGRRGFAAGEVLREAISDVRTGGRL